MTAKALDKTAIAERQLALSDWLQEGRIEMTQTGLIIRDPDFPFEEYEQLGALLAGFHRSSCWWIGDWILYGEGAYAEKYAQAMTVTRLAEGTLMNYVSVCRRVPRSRRRIELPFSVHVEVAPLPPAEQKEWLAVAARDDLRQRDLRALLRPVKEGEASSEAAIKKLNRNGPPVIEDLRALARSVVKQATGNGRGGYTVPGELIIRMAALLGEDGYE